MVKVIHISFFFLSDHYRERELERDRARKREIKIRREMKSGRDR